MGKNMETDSFVGHVFWVGLENGEGKTLTAETSGMPFACKCKHGGCKYFKEPVPSILKIAMLIF